MMTILFPDSMLIETLDFVSSGGWDQKEGLKMGN